MIWNKQWLVQLTLAWFLLLGLCVCTNTLFAQTKHPSPLEAESAFVFSTVVHSNEVLAKWDVAPGYFLYRDRIHFVTDDPNANVTVQYPKTDIKVGLHDKRLEVYSGKLQIPVTVKSNVSQIKLTVKYQGCSEEGFCYPPMQQTLLLEANQLVAGTTNSVADQPTRNDFSTLLTDQHGIKNLLESKSFTVVMLIFLGIGLLLAFTPCVLPMIPILTGIIIGQKKTVSQKTIFLLSLAYVLGTALTYALAGLLAAAMGNSIQFWLQRPVVIAFVSALFALLAASLFGFYDLSLPNSWINRVTLWSNKQRSGSYIGVFFMGILSSLVVSPCVTAPLVGVLIYIGETGDLLFGASALFSMGIGMGIPLLLIGISAGKWLPKHGPWMDAVKKIFGFIMLAMAIWLLSRVMSPSLTIFAWGLLLLSLAIFFWAYLPELIGKHTLNRSLAFLVGVCSLLLLLGSIGFNNPLIEWVSLSKPVADGSFTVVRNIDDVNQRLALASKEHKPVILDFYADWCESCIEMDRKVFNHPGVQNKLANFVLLRADLTKITNADQELLKKFKVIAPPTVVFFDPHGQEMNDNRIVGEVNAKEFLTRLEAGLKSSRDQHSAT